MATIKSKGVVVGVLQVAIGVIGLIVGLVTLTKESAPYVQRMRDQQHHQYLAKQADIQSRMNIQYIYRGNDGTYRYYSDNTGTYWTRVNIQGVIEYAQNPSVVR